MCSVFAAKSSVLHHLHKLKKTELLTKPFIYKGFNNLHKKFSYFLYTLKLKIKKNIYIIVLGLPNFFCEQNLWKSCSDFALCAFKNSEVKGETKTEKFENVVIK